MHIRDSCGNEADLSLALADAHAHVFTHGSLRAPSLVDTLAVHCLFPVDDPRWRSQLDNAMRMRSLISCYHIRYGGLGIVGMSAPEVIMSQPETLPFFPDLCLHLKQYTMSKIKLEIKCEVFGISLSS